MKLLIVEDSRFVQNVIRKTILGNFPSFEVMTASDGEIGYNKYLEHKPNLITTDLLMPNVSGQEMLKKIRENDPDTNIIVISADVQTTTRDEVEELGITGFISKPVTGERANSLIKLIKEALHVE